MVTLVMCYLAFTIDSDDGEAGIAATSRAVPSWATPHHGARRERKPVESHTLDRVGSREASVPPGTWTESGRTPVLDRIL